MECRNARNVFYQKNWKIVRKDIKQKRYLPKHTRMKGEK